MWVTGEMCTVFWVGGKLNERENLEEQCVDVRIMLKSISKEIRWESVDWIDLAQDTGRWRALVNAVLKLWVP